MKSRTIYCLLAALTLGLNQSCTENSSKEFNVDGISIKTLVRANHIIDVYIKSQNPEFNCINLNGIGGSGGDLEGVRPKSPGSLLRSDLKYGKSSILYFDNQPRENLMTIGKKYKQIKLRGEVYNYIMFPIFNCDKFRKNIRHYAYIYTLAF